MKIFLYSRSLVIILILSVIIAGCQKEQEKVEFEYPSYTELKEGMYLITNESDSMQLSKTEYLSFDNGDLVIDPNYYQTHDVKRGDVIYFEMPADYKSDNLQNNIARIIALPNEKLRIKKGQIYINNEKLKTFYGKSLTGGLHKKEFLKMIKKAPGSKCEKDCLHTFKSTFDFNLKATLIPDHAIYVIGDNWSRSFDSRIFGTLPELNILGKVMGYAKP
ncbi:signal peptidase I [Paenibacillus gorillae]|uniref:signal peptidase I n=1 Tax=Paenibacillus gorillae TaxID=1243662 RepID=UPI0004AEBC5C|nr:signal peptidase I [Paenibacillus gorillae]